MEPLISVIVPVYNVEKWLNKCVDSILGQTHKNLEVILVDDGSPDRCGEICDEYAKKDARVKVIHKENGGLPDARNKGIDASIGEYIAFVDSDDYIASDMYEEMLAKMTEHGADMAVCGVYNISPYRSNISSVCDDVKVMTNDEAMEAYYSTQLIGCSACNKLYKNVLWKEFRFPKGICEDIRIFYKVLASTEKLVHIGKAKYYYNVRESSIMHSSFNPELLILNEAIDEEYEAVKNRYPNVCKKLWDKRIEIRVDIIKKIACSSEEKRFNEALDEMLRFLSKNEPYDEKLKKVVHQIVKHRERYIAKVKLQKNLKELLKKAYFFRGGER